MKKLLVFLGTFFICAVAFAQTINVNWKVGDTTYASNTCEYGGTLTVPSTPPTKYGYTFQGWQSYIFLEYIESTGTQYIDLGRKVRSDYTYKIKMAWTELHSSTLMASKEYQTWTNGKYLGITYESDGRRKTWMSRASTSDADINARTLFTPTVNIINNIVWKPSARQLIFNGTTLNGSGTHQSTSVFETANNMYLFAGNNVTGPNAFDYVKLYSWQMYDTDGTTLLMNLVPAKRNSDNAIGMYDTVTHTFFTNAGTGDFVAGPVKQ